MIYNEIIISNYDAMFSFNVAIDGVVIDKEIARNIVREIEKIDFKIYNNNIDRVNAFKTFAMKRLNCKRLIYCDCGGIEIYEP